MSHAQRPRQGARPARARSSDRQSPQRSPAASVLRLQRAAGNAAVAGLVARGRVLQRTPDFEHELEIGSDVSVQFAQEAKRVAAGTIDDAALLSLHEKALADDDSVGDAERMLMAALLVPANARTVAEARVARGAKLTLKFARTAATAATIRRIGDLGRKQDTANVAKGRRDVAAAETANSLPAIRESRRALETAADAQIADLARGDGRIADAPAFADRQPLPPYHSDILAAMLAAGSDSTRRDMVLAAAVYAIAHAERNPLADDVKAGRIKVDEVRKVPAPPGVTGVVAAYVTAGSGQREKGDTIYLSTDFKITNLAELEGIQPGDTKRYDRLRGESRLDWMGP
jgi:hypothetical protein